MKIAVLMSTYNGENYIKEQIDSILAQTGDFTLELWVRDDGSRDGTVDILARYAEAGKLRWYTGENRKPAHSFMDLLLSCPEYDYYAFADQDDVWQPDKLASGISQLKAQEGPALYCANAQLVDRHLDSLGRCVYKQPPRLDLHTLSCAGDLLGCTMVFNAPLAQLLQSCPMPGAMVMHDFYLALVCLLAGGNILFDQTPRMLYRQHGANVVGASHSKLSALKNRFKYITRRPPVTVGQQAQTVLAQYPDLGTPQQRAWLKKLTDSRFFARLGVACSRQTRYVNKNKSLTLRLAFLLGHR